VLNLGGKYADRAVRAAYSDISRCDISKPTDHRCEEPFQTFNAQPLSSSPYATLVPRSLAISQNCFKSRFEILRQFLSEDIGIGTIAEPKSFQRLERFERVERLEPSAS
jgi:hypothetical protein